MPNRKLHHFLQVFNISYICSGSACEQAWTSIASDPAASTCLSVQQLVPFVTAAQNNASLVTPVTNWVTSLCSQPVCSKDTISAVYKLVTAKCPPAAQWAFLEPAYYPTWHKVVCLKKFVFLSLLSWTDGLIFSHSANSTLCITELLTNIESYSGTLTPANFQKVFGNGADLPATPANITCTNCTKAAYNIVINDVPSAVTSAKPAYQSLCGAAFVGG